MPYEDLQIEIHPKRSVDVNWPDARYRPLTRWSIFVACTAYVFGFSYLIFLHPDGYGITGLYLLLHTAHNSADFFLAIFALLIFSVLLPLAFGYGLHGLFLSGWKLHCDRTQMVVSRIPWHCLTGQWKTRVFNVPEIEQMRYGVVAKGKAKSIYGIIFRVEGQKQMILWGLKSPEGRRILHGLRELGFDAAHDEGLCALAAEERRDRRAEL